MNSGPSGKILVSEMSLDGLSGEFVDETGAPVTVVEMDINIRPGQDPRIVARFYRRDESGKIVHDEDGPALMAVEFEADDYENNVLDFTMCRIEAEDQT